MGAHGAGFRRELWVNIAHLGRQGDGMVGHSRGYEILKRGKDARDRVRVARTRMPATGKVSIPAAVARITSHSAAMSMTCSRLAE